MIDRKSLSIAGAFIAVMLGLALWRVSLLADWTVLPYFANNGTPRPPRSSAGLLIAPGMMAFVVLMQTVKRWMGKASEAQWQPWLRRNVLLTGAVGVLCLMLEGFVISRSFGGDEVINSVQFMRVMMVFWGIVMIAVSNAAPRLPWIQSRFRPLDLNSENGARYLRAVGYSGVVTGFVVIAGALFVPFSVGAPMLRWIALASAALALTVFVRLKRKQTH